MITRQDVAARLTDDLHHRLSLEDLVNWAEDAMMQGELDDSDIEVIRFLLARVGLANVKEFGLPGKILRNSCLVWVTMCVLR